MVQAMARIRTLTARELAVATLHRQGLLERWCCSAAEAVHRLVAVQAQWSPAPYAALAARVEGFAVADLERALRRGTVVKSTLMRGTLHLVAARDLPALAGASLEHSARRLRGGRNRELDLGEAFVDELRAYLSEPRTTDELRAHVAERVPDAFAPGGPLDVARLLVAHVHELPSGLFDRHGKFALRAWEGALEPEPAATAALAAAYLAAYGPATRDDLAAFSWLSLTQLDRGLAELGPLRRLTDEAGRELLDLPRAPLPREAVATPPRLLSRFDHAWLAYRDREHHRLGDARPIFSSVNAEVRASYLLDGRLAGTWRLDSGRMAAATLVLEPLPGGPGASAELEAEAERTVAVLAPDADRRNIAWDAAFHA